MTWRVNEKHVRSRRLDIFVSDINELVVLKRIFLIVKKLRNQVWLIFMWKSIWIVYVFIVYNCIFYIKIASCCIILKNADFDIIDIGK